MRVCGLDDDLQAKRPGLRTRGRPHRGNRNTLNELATSPVETIHEAQRRRTECHQDIELPEGRRRGLRDLFDRNRVLDQEFDHFTTGITQAEREIRPPQVTPGQKHHRCRTELQRQQRVHDGRLWSLPASIVVVADPAPAPANSLAKSDEMGERAPAPPRKKALLDRRIETHRLRLIRRLHFDLKWRTPRMGEIEQWYYRPHAEMVDAFLKDPEVWGNWFEQQLFYFLLLDRFRPKQGRVTTVPDRIARGEIPVPIASVLLRRIAAAEATVEAGLTGNRKTMVEAMILDGGVSDYATAEKLTEAMLRAQAEHLPQFG